MALVGNMIAESFAGNASVINYDMFVAVFAMLTLFYLIVIAFKEQFTFHKFVPAALDLLNALFWFIAAVTMSAELGAHSCSNKVCSMFMFGMPKANQARTTSNVTRSPTARAICQVDAEKRKRSPHFCGSAGHASCSACSFPSHLRVVLT